jgi:predicted ATPase/DNA-binding winged helix-turn-helix (wHTH) protein
MDTGSSEQAAPAPATEFRFGPFRYVAARRELHDANGPVRAGSRALQLLEVLLESPGRLYSREELVSRVWPHTVVEETSLRVHMSALRRMLGDGQDGARYIANVPGRGYSFVADVEPIVRVAPSTQDARAAPRGLPARLTRPIGRGHDIARICELLARQRLVSIVGAGGMGKTTAALAVAESQRGLHARGACFVDLSLLSDGALVVVEVGRSVGLDVARGEPLGTLENALRGQQVLIVLDNCEHVIEAVAALVDRLLRSCPNVRFLATSREPLESEAEWVFRLPPLGAPGPDMSLGLDDVLSFPAIQLFVDRAQAADDTFELTEANVSAIRQICEFLDGIPLAIELAAARAHGLGVSGLLQRLGDAFDLLTRGRRTAMSRHQTLHAVMNWSYELLTATEKLVLQRLAVFRSTFDLDAAVAVVSSADLPAAQGVQGVLSLCAKSLLAPDAGSTGVPTHRLLYITRLFAERMLASSEGAAQVHHRHALHVRARMAERNKVQEVLAGFRKSAALLSIVAEARAAITWGLWDENDVLLGLEIVAESTRTWHIAGLVEEFGQYLDVAVDKARHAGIEGTRLALRLQVAVGLFSGQSQAGSAAHGRAVAAVDRTLVDRFDAPADKIEAFTALCASAYGHGRYLQVARYCDEVREIARGELEPLGVAIGDRFSTFALHALGRHDEAEGFARRVMQLDADVLEPRFQSLVPFQVATRIRLARIQWLRGEFRQAWATVLDITTGDEGDHIYAKCQPLGLAAIPIAIWKGDVAAAQRWGQELLHHSTRGTIPYWQAYAKVYCCLLEGRPLSPGGAEAQLLEKNTPLMDTVATLQSAAPHPATLARVHQGEVGWCAPEVLRLAALAQLDAQDNDSRDHCLVELRRACELSVVQGARFWTLRIAISLCEVAPAGSTEHIAARDLLQSLLDAFDDGSAQPDLQRARRLVASEASTRDST